MNFSVPCACFIFKFIFSKTLECFDLLKICSTILKITQNTLPNVWDKNKEWNTPPVVEFWTIAKFFCNKLVSNLLQHQEIEKVYNKWKLYSIIMIFWHLLWHVLKFEFLARFILARNITFLSTFWQHSVYL